MVHTDTSYEMKLSIKAAGASAIMKSQGWTLSRMTFVNSAGKTVSGLQTCGQSLDVAEYVVQKKCLHLAGEIQ